MTTNHDHLREVAQRATPGRWIASASDGETGHGFCAQVFCQNGPSIATMDHMGEQGTADANYFATFNPQTILALLDAYEASQSALERLETNFRLILSGKPCRDVAECLAEVEAARESIGDSHE